MAYRKYSSIQLLKDHLEDIPRDALCLEWPRYRNHNGYGQIHLRRGHSVFVHRLSYEFTYGPIPVGLFVLHKCDNPACFRPDHLFLGTKGDNMQDCLNKGRFKPAIGERHRSAIMTTAEVLAVRRLHAAGLSRAELAAIFPVGIEGIRKIVTGRSWRHI